MTQRSSPYTLKQRQSLIVLPGILGRAMQSMPNLKLEESFCGFCDTLHLLKTIVPHQQSYSQEALVDKILNEKYVGHDALEDSRY